MPCSVEIKNETINSITRVFANDLLKSDPKMPRKDAIASAREQATQLVESTMAEQKKEATEAVMKADEVVLGSEEKSEFDWTTADAIRENVFGNIESMKGLMRELHELGGNKADDAHVKHLESLFDEMNPVFFENMKMSIKFEADKSDGIIVGNKVGITVSKAQSANRNHMSDAEIYAHETIHAMTMFAMRSKNHKAVKLRGYLHSTMKKALEATKWEQFAPDNATEEENEIAQELYKYIFDSKNADEEFIAHVLTNPRVMEVMKNVNIKDGNKATSVWGRVKELFTQLMHILAGDFSFKNREGSAYDVVKDLAFDLAEINNRALNKRNAKINLPMRIWEGFQKYNVGTAEFLSDFWDKHVDSKDYGPPPTARIARAIWMSKMVVKMVTNKDYRKAFELILHGYGMNARGDVQTILRDFFEQDSMSQDVDMLALLSDKVDTAKNTLVSGIVQAVHEGFTRRLTKEEETALSKVLVDTDLQSVSGKLDRKALSLLLRDEAEVNRRLSRAKHLLKKEDPENYTWNDEQAQGLGFYMATGQGHIAQNLNAHAIVTAGLTGDLRKANPRARNLVDEIATLTALQYTKQTDKDIVAGLIAKERLGIENILNIHKEFVAESIRDAFGNSRQNMIKGYSKEIFDNDINIMVASSSKETEDSLKNEGYTKQFVLKNQKDVKGSGEMAVYVSKTMANNELYRTATRMTAVKSRGTSISSGIHERDDISLEEKKAYVRDSIADLDVERMNLAAAIAAGTVKFKDIEYGVMPVTDENGFVTDYRYVMSKDNKEKLLGQTSLVSEVLGKSFGSVFDKKETYTQNEKVLDLILDDMAENYEPGESIGKNNKRYLFISADSTDWEVQDLYKRLPKIFKDAMQANNPKGIAVREDLFHAYFGYRHMSIANNEMLKKITPEVIMTILRVAEHLWMEIIKITKVDILLKMPVVIIGNLVSNFMYAVMTGTNPVELAKEYLDSSREVARYFKANAELNELRIAKKTGNARKLDLRRIPMLERQLKESDIHELAELGIYQSIVEDLDTRELDSTNRVKKEINTQLDKLPDFVKSGIETLYLVENTAYYKFMNNVLTKSDLIARDIENRKLKRIQEKQANGEMPLPKWFVMRDVDKIRGAKYTKTTKKLSGKELSDFNKLADANRHAAVLDAFINYNKPSGRVEEYLNKMGFIMFTKYFKRIQKVIASTSQKHPLNVAMLLLGEATLGDVDTIYDQTLFTKSWYNFGLSQDDWIPGTDPFTRVMELLNPPLVQLLNDPKIF